MEETSYAYNDLGKLAEEKSKTVVNTPFQYAKREINPIYLNKVNSEKIMIEIYEI